MGLRLLVGNRFQVLFHSPPGVLFTFPSRYWFTIGGKECLALGGGPPVIPARFLVSRGPWELGPEPQRFPLPGFHLRCKDLPVHSGHNSGFFLRSGTPFRTVRS